MTTAMKRIISCIPNTITSLNLLSGCIAIYMAFHLQAQMGAFTGLQWFYVCIAAAAVFDFCDGLSARLLKAYSAIGKELDSLSDLVSFGVAPGMLILNTMLAVGDALFWSFGALLIPVLGALRLAKFNVDDSQSTTFTGLPIPANALFWMGVSDWISQYGYPGTPLMLVLIVLISLCMVCGLRMFSLKFKNLTIYDNVKRYGIIIAAVAFVIWYGVSGLAWTILLYILISVFTRKNPD